jgi:hypothetical protein
MHRSAWRLTVGLAAFVAVLATSVGCNDECTRNSDCPAGKYCFQGECRPLPDGGDVVEDVAPADVPEAEAADEAVVEAEDDAAVEPDEGGADGDAGEGPCSGPWDCDDLNECTVDTCGEAGECVHTAREDGEPCTDDGIHCDGYERCVGGVCASSGPPCAGGGNPCAAGGCDETTDSCVTDPVPEGSSCDNGLYCDGADVCRSGACASGPGPCDGTGDGICTVSVCDEDTHGCSSEPAADGTDCDDGDLCNGRDTCMIGSCTADTHMTCDDFNPCTEDTCTFDPVAGGVVCSYASLSGGDACNDGDPCAGTTGRVLICTAEAGGCAYGTDAPCSDGSLCRLTLCREGVCGETSEPGGAMPVDCGGSVTAATIQGADDVADYGATCGAGLTGGEKVYQVTVGATDSQLTAALSDLAATGALTVLVLSDHCTPSTCLGASAAGGGVTVPVTGGATYYVVIDGAANARGKFTLSVTCR